MGMSHRNSLLFCSLILIGLIGMTSLFAPDTTVTSRADWTYPDGYDPHGGYLDRVTLVVYPPEDEQLGLQALQAGIISAWDEHVTADKITELEATSGVEVTSEPGDMYRMFNLDCGHFPTNITGYRRALAYALDKSAVIQASTGGLAFFQDCALPINFGNWSYETQLTETYYAQDIIKANACLEGALFRDLNGDGWRDYDKNNNSAWNPGIDLDSEHFEIQLHHLDGHAPSGNAVKLAVEAIHKCGIRAEVSPVDYWETLLWGFEGLNWCWPFSDFDSAALLYDLFHSSTGNNQWYFGGWTNATFDQYAENLMAARTVEEANHWAWKCQEILWYEQPMIVCYNDVYTHAYRTDIWEGYINMNGRNRIGNGYSLVHIRHNDRADGPWGCFPTEYFMSLQEGLDTTNYLMSNSKHTSTVFQLVYERLWTYSPYDWTPQPSLAYEWETEPTVASGDIQDGEKYTFYIYENATWNDGIPVTADDVAYSLTLGLQDPYNSENYQHVYKTNIVDHTTIEIFTNETGYFEWTQATRFTVFPAHIWAIQENISAWVPTIPELIGSGPYIFGTYVPGQYVVLERHPDWHFAVPQPPRTPCPTPNEFEFYFIYAALVAVIAIQICILAYLINRRHRDASKK